MPRFRNLTPAQERAFEAVALNMPPHAAPRALEALETAGLIVGEDRVLSGWPPVTVREYYVPVWAHLKWCAWCEKHVTDL